jgi:phosphatidylglycerophosphate synthase
VTGAHDAQDWRTKPTDRFILKWIKLNLSARISPHVAVVEWIRPWMVTCISTLFGILGGCLFALGWGFAGGLFTTVGQVLDGVDGQVARLTNRQSAAGAFCDSVLDRYADGAVVIGITVYATLLPCSLAYTLLIGSAALIGSGLISYTTARAETLGLNMGAPTLASKGTRTAVMAVSGLLSPLSPWLPLWALAYVALHANVVALTRLLKAYR